MSRLLLTLLIGTGCSEYKIQSAAETDAGVERAPQILASPEQVSVGWVESGDAGVEVVQIANIGEADLNVTDLRLELFLPVLLVRVRVGLGVEVVEDELRFSRIQA